MRAAGRRYPRRRAGAGAASHQQRRERAPLLAEHRLEAFSERPGKKRALTGGGDRDLQWAAPDDRGRDPVALMCDVGDVEKHALAVGLIACAALSVWVVTRIDGEIRAREVTCLERTAQMDDVGPGGLQP